MTSNPTKNEVRQMNGLDKLIGTTPKGFIIAAGLVTCLLILIAVNLAFGNEYLFAGLLDYSPASVPALWHWGIMVFGISMLMIVSAHRTHIQFETMLFCVTEKAFMVYLYLSSIDEPWIKAYTIGFIMDSSIALYSLLYFASHYGRSDKWARQD